MMKLRSLEMPSAVFLLVVATAIVASAQSFQTLASFDGTNGTGPFYMAPVQGIDGNLYGTTAYGGTNCNCGTVFRMTRTGALTSLYSFDQLNGSPYTGLIVGTDGNLYGTTAEGPGTVFKITPDGQQTILYTFCSQNNCSDGLWPYAPLIQASDGNFYGTTYYGGSQNLDMCWNGREQGCGTVFRITKDGRLTTIYRFCQEPNCADGIYPTGGLVQGTDGSLYGTTNGNFYAPGLGAATVFKITTAGKLTTLYTFCSLQNCADGEYPYPGLIQASDGNFYGTTAYGGTNCVLQNGCGTVFRVSPTGFAVVHSFDGDDGSNPYAGLIQATDGSLYGTTTAGGDMQCNPPSGCGTVFRISLTGSVITLHVFDSDAFPQGGLLQGTNGKFYGTTYFGGSHGYGSVFSLDLGLGSFVSFLRGAAKIGQSFGILGQSLKGTSNVSLNGVSANFAVVSGTLIKASVPQGATTGYVTVSTPTGVLKSNVPFHVIQ